ncbi:DUF983 domain-containing protein [Parasphingorhabdus cellanae]|uniref:DUF983 domain-containing protein n=1 Tax=Parasphingorhabdus cellanae TaxID=2806553 RepID=A0ABX7T6Y2_9SPHN|nr:DUF983 domain-containing protein [Parasphingorhabdus cellanae]QTD55708.1 DUF983 domain-containing protein [Parasphingorhabdus cellanae]
MEDEVVALIKSGMKLKCGHCGQGKLFRSYLKFHDNCPHCRQDLTVADTADGPAFFVGFFTMIVFAPIILVLVQSVETVFAKITAFIVGILVCAVVCLVLLPPVKAILLNLQINYDSGEGTTEK